MTEALPSTARPASQARAFSSRAALLILSIFLAAVSASAQGSQQQPQQPAPTPQTAAPASAQPPVGETIDDDEVLRIDSNLVSIPAVVTESTGRAVPNLRLEDFELRIDGKPRGIGELSKADAPVVLALLFDNSSSLSKAREFEKQAATRFFRRIVRPIDRAAVFSVSTVPVLARPLTNNVGVLVHSIENFPEPEGATALFDSIIEAARYLSPHEGRKVIVIVSDGNDTISDTTFDQALQSALKADCQIYVVGTGDVENPNLTDTIARKRLQVFAAQTGGALYVPRAVEELDTAFEQISKDISQQYVISYYPTDDPADGRFRSIGLSVKSRPTLRVRAREGYYAAAGNSRVRARRAGGKSDEEAANLAPRGGQRQAAPSLDPLYSTTHAAAATARNAPDEASVSIQTKGSTDFRRASRPGPLENFETLAPERRAAPAVAETRPAPAVNAARPVASESVNAETRPANAPPAPARQTSTLAAEPAPTGAGPATDHAPSRETAAREAAPKQNEAASASVVSKNSDAKQEPAPDQSMAVSGGVLNGRAKRLPRPAYPAAASSLASRARSTWKLRSTRMEE
jgi:Ca-activated chloride channel family protein